MKKYSVTCSCGDKVVVEANSVDEAKVLMKEKMMTQEAIDAHWNEKHASDAMPKPTMEQVEMMVDSTLVEEVEPEVAAV